MASTLIRKKKNAMEKPEHERETTSADHDEKQFQSDTEKLARRHLEDPNHVITDEELKNVRVGMTPPPDQPTEEAIRDSKDKIADHKSDNEDDTIPGGQKMTPWDVIGP